jgi:hypothetical protein
MPKTSPEIFISYRHTDNTEYLRYIIDGLIEVDYKVHYDQKLPSGKPWWDGLLDMIQSSGHFIVLLSKAWLESAYCQAELEFALKIERHILYIFIDSEQAVLKRLPPEIRQDQIEMFYKETVIQKIRRWIDANKVVNLLPESDILKSLRPKEPIDPIQDFSDAIRKGLRPDEIQPNIERARLLARQIQYSHLALELLQEMSNKYMLTPEQREDVKEIINVHQIINTTVEARVFNTDQMIQLLQKLMLIPEFDAYDELSDLLIAYLEKNIQNLQDFAHTFRIYSPVISVHVIVAKLIEHEHLLRVILNGKNPASKKLSEDIYKICQQFIVNNLDRLFLGEKAPD